MDTHRLSRILTTLVFFSSLSFFLTTKAFAQSATLRGTVTDAENGDVLVGANIVVTSVKVKTGAATSSSGKFEIKNLAAGTYTFAVSFIGYEKKTLTDLVLMVGETKSLDISLNATGIQMNPVTVTASRRPEKLLEAPASITVLQAQEIEARTAFSAAEHLKALPAVDIAQNGLNQSRVIVRGFNESYPRNLLILVDNRITRIAALRGNFFQWIPTIDEDIERIEIVSGPGSALYGPNTAHGVVHMITKSPFGSEGTQVSVSGGERSVIVGTLRHAASFNNKIGYKFSARYYRGHDFEFFDPVEEEARQAAIDAGADPNTLKLGKRDFDVDNLAIEGAVHLRPSSDLTLILNGGLVRASNIELNPIGTSQVIDFIYNYIHARLRYKDLFLQAYLNRNDAGDDSYNLRTGLSFAENSSVFSAQAQHRLTLRDRQTFTYGLDLFLSRPDSRGSIYGGYEDDDDINEIGAYLQSETRLSSKLDFIVAARIDDHNRVEDLTFSPRAALVFKPTPTDNFRLTYNRAFRTPGVVELFAEILSGQDIFGLGGLFEPVLGFGPGTDIRIQAIPKNGFHFGRGANGLPQFRSPFAPLDPRGLSTSDFIDMNDAIFTNVMWGLSRQAVLGAFLPTFQETLAQQGLPADQIAALSQAFADLVPEQVSGVNNVLRKLDLETAGFNLIEVVEDLAPLKVTRNETFEAGYKGILGEKLLLGVDIYHTRFKNFIGPFLVETPNVFLDPTTLGASLAQHFVTDLGDPDNAELNAVLLALDDPALGGNDNGSAADELANLFVAGTDNNGAAFIPFGTVSPKEAFDPTALLLMQRNFGNISFSGLDLSFTYFANKYWSFGGTYSYISEKLFEDLDGVDDVALNVPKHKFGAILQYRNAEAGFDGQLRLRFVDSFTVKSDVHIGEVDAYAVLDLNAHYTLPFSPNTRLTLTVQNLTNNKHKEFVNVPDIGRIALVRLTQSF